MKAYRTEMVLTESGSIALKDLPFQAGESVEIIVLERPAHQMSQQFAQAFPLEGTVLHYEDPFGPATALEDWDVLQ